MPRRKGYGIPPTKRIKIDEDVENNGNEINDTAVVVATVAGSNDASVEMRKMQSENHVKESERNILESYSHYSATNSIKYLHKKFKKMAAVLADDSAPAATVAVADQPVYISTAQPACAPAAPSPPHSRDVSAVAAAVVPTAVAAAAAAAATMTQSSLPECTRTDVLAGTKLNNCCATNSSTVNQNCVTAPAKPPTAFTTASVYCNARTTTAAVATVATVTTVAAAASVITTAPLPAEEDVTGVPVIIGRYACPYCKLVCNKPSVLQKHIRAHTNERPYPCRPCGFAFKTRSNLYKHCRSRSHSLKLEEVGVVDNKMACGLEEEVDEDEDDQQQHVIKDGSVGGVESASEEKTEQPRTSIYKPKFHKAASYIQSSGAASSLSSKSEQLLTAGTLNKLGLQLKIPSASVQSSRSTPSTPSPFSGSSPSPEFLQRHISKLISENQAIVETTDPFWSKKFYQRSKEGSPSSPLSTSSSSSLESKKRAAVEAADEKQQPPVESKLAHALLQPRAMKSASMNDISNAEDTQPLNLTICKDVAKCRSLERVDEKWDAEDRTNAVADAVELPQKPLQFQVHHPKEVKYEFPELKKDFMEVKRGLPEYRKNSLEVKNDALEFKSDYRETKKDLTDAKKDIREYKMDLVETNGSIKDSKIEITADVKADISEVKRETSCGNARFVRPTSLPLKPGTFVPKKLLPGAVSVLPLISPETPRPNKSYGQLYIGGNAYTYLGLKCSTRSTFCTLHKSQPTYVPLSPEHNKISMYSNWKVHSEVDPYLLGVPATKIMACYDSRQRYSPYTVVHGKTKDAVTHSSHWFNRSRTIETGDINMLVDQDENKENNAHLNDGCERTDDATKSLKMCMGKIEPTDDYTYVRGRGRGKYVCLECGIRCRKPSMLKKHIRTHTDVRPYTCKHCVFSFKTKGNLTKHMKSKAHYKKCIELGIVPVPTVVDDSYVDEEVLSKQAQQIEEGQDLDETEEDEDEEEDDDDDDENEDDYGGDDPKCQLEHEVAKSLLSLSKLSHQTVSEQYANAGLVSLHARPNTYPYNFSASTSLLSSKAHTPTLMLISEQKERETVSKNTGLARELQPTLRIGHTTMKQKCEPQPAGRYYFGSPSDKEVATTVSDLQESVIKDSASITSVFPIDLSSKHASERNAPWSADMSSGGSITTVGYPVISGAGISEILTPVSEPVLLATICSTIDRLSAAPPPPLPPVANSTDVTEGSVMLQTYLKERAVQDLKIKQQYQSPHIKVDQRDFDMKYNVYKEAFQLGATAVTVAPVDKPEDIRTTPSPKRKNHFLCENDVPEKTTFVDRGKLKLERANDIDAKENFALTADPEKSECSTSVIILVGSPNSGCSNSPKKLKAEFISPCNKPLPKYASVLEDGRSKCIVCNKIFSKPSQLRLHVNIHYFEQPFRCESCAVSFRTKGHLHKHLGSNSHLNKVSMNSAGNGQTSTNNPRPFKCDDCSVGFRIHGHLAKHLRSKMHIMKLECLGKLPFGTYAEMERCGINMNDIDTTDCENSLESLQRIAKGVVGGSVMYVNNTDEGSKMMAESAPF